MTPTRRRRVAALHVVRVGAWTVSRRGRRVWLHPDGDGAGELSASSAAALAVALAAAADAASRAAKERLVQK